MLERNLEDVAIVIRPGRDNVAVVTVDSLEAGDILRYNDGQLTVTGRTLLGQSFAIREIQKGEAYITLGDPIGLASRQVFPGEPIDDTKFQPANASG